MQINKINNHTQSSNNTNFKARLFGINGQEIKSFQHGAEKIMANRGSKKTEIFINNFISTKNGYEGYKNEIDLTIKNPLFGAQRFIQNIFHPTNAPIKGDYNSELWHMDLLTGLKSNNCKNLENKALRMSLLKKIKAGLNGYDNESGDSLVPIDILTERLLLMKPESHGFSFDRIKDFEQIAKKLLNEIINNGIKNIKL